ncbi:zinc finger protein 84-like isoform X3 [Maniola jurtina]|uniref:zinc finger protein 84-like isoform X3 n=1 Tax=Maniola jurtina TaxID=191418 RepID=UPI001E68B43B|nr:zinc finger protein 84-like isoform X3 [Maniola jurtina]
MRCCVPSCNNCSENSSQAEGITFYSFPSEGHLRAAWLRALGKQDSHLPDSAVVCSQHFLNDDFYETESGIRQIRTGAIPSTVQVCRICLDTDSKLVLMSKYKLEEEYEKLTQNPLCDQGNLKQTVCIQCAQRLINFSTFRAKSLRARALMMDLVGKHKLVTRQHIKMINRTKHQLKSNMVLTSLGPDHCDLHILEHPSGDKQTESEETRLKVTVKIEENDESMQVDDMEMKNEDDNDVNDFVQDPLKYESASLQCTLCLEEFVHEHVYMQHMNMHLQNNDGDGECDMSQVCKPHTAVSSSSSHSSLITENKQADPSPSTTLASRLSANFATFGVTLPTQEANTSDQQIPSKQTNDESKRFVCQYCPFRCKYQSNFTTHMRTHTGEKPFACTHCDYKCVTNSGLVNHMRTHTGDKPYSCKICDFKSSYKGNLVGHMRTHTGEKPFACTHCEYKSVTNSALVNHLRTHTGEKPYSCEFCEYKCVSNTALLKHLRTHTGEKRFSCELCEYKCVSNSALMNHMRTHTGEKPFSCKVCDYKFAHKSHLVRHMKTHTGEKPYLCKFCEYRTAHKDNLVNHTRTHTGERPYWCEVCEYKSAAKSKLVIHMRTHTGEKPFGCDLCEFKCAVKHNLVIHRRSHTGDK